MIGSINGILKFKTDGIALIECAGVGYEVSLTNSAFCNLPDVGENVELYTYLNVRDDGMFLFGFTSLEEKALFMQLITVSGIGPKTALQILSGIKLSDLISGIANENTALIANIKGIGKKTAERVVLELKDKLNPMSYIGINSDENPASISSTAMSDAITTLTSLGLNKYEATNLARSVAAANDSAEQIVEKAFKNMR